MRDHRESVSTIDFGNPGRRIAPMQKETDNRVHGILKEYLMIFCVLSIDTCIGRYLELSVSLTTTTNALKSIFSGVTVTMAQEILTALADDLDGSEAVETICFSLDGVGYEINLSLPNATELRYILAQYIECGRRTDGRRKIDRKTNNNPRSIQGPIAQEIKSLARDQRKANLTLLIGRET